MVDLLTFGIVLIVVLVVMLRKTSAGVAVLGLLAGVLLDQLLSDWVIGMLPNAPDSFSQYVPVAVHLLITFIPVVASLIAVKVPKHHMILSLLASLVLGFLIVFFGLQIIAPLPQFVEPAKNSGLLHFLQPYQNTILAVGAILALVEMITSHNSKSSLDKKKKK